MTGVAYNNHPTVSDIVLFDLVTVDTSGNAITPYKINTIVIYFIERGYTEENIYQYTKSVGNTLYTEYFKEAVPVAVFGNAQYPAWIATDLQQAFVTQNLDGNGNPIVGSFHLEWTPSMAREGDYLLCYQWTPIAAGDTMSANIAFYLYSNTQSTTSVPSHFTNPTKYTTLLDAYQPPMFSMMLGHSDLTSDVLARLNKSIASGFTDLEDYANQIVDLLDANVVNDFLLPYLANLFGIRLIGNDTTLWRRQVKQAVPLAKKKGTLAALQESLANADMQLLKFTQLWQVVSSATWQEGFVVTAAQVAAGTISWTITKLAILPMDGLNFEVWYRPTGTTTYTQLSTNYVVYNNSTGKTIATWVGNTLHINPIALASGDVVRLIYRVGVVADQSVEDYIRSLPLADQRDEIEVTLPIKNWNVRLIAEDDPMFSVIIPERHPFQYPVIFGQVRTEFPYSENLYNMEEYNGSTRDSTLPCDLDKTFQDYCSSCISSKFSVDLEIEDLSSERIQEANDVIEATVPFHAVIQSVNFTGSKNEFFPSPEEYIECLIGTTQDDNVIATQMNFNRLIEDGSSDAKELKRNMLATATASTYSGIGSNLAITLFSPGIQFDSLSFSDPVETYLEILSGSDTGKYQVQSFQRFTVDIIQNSPNTINWPLDSSGFPFRLSNVLFTGSVNIAQMRDYRFSDSSVTFIDYGVVVGWTVRITAGPNIGSYSITGVHPDNSLSLSNFPTTNTVSSIQYQILDASHNVVVSGTTGFVMTISTGQVDFGLNAVSMGIRSGDYIKYGSTQYQIIGIGQYATIGNYTAGTVVGAANVNVYRRVIDNAVGYLEVRGMQIQGTVPAVSYVAENNKFQENYLILIGTNYYQIDTINGNKMTINGPPLQWGLTGTPVTYSIVQFAKTSPITTQDGPDYAGSLPFYQLDRRGNDSVETITKTSTPMAMNFLPVGSEFGMPMYMRAAILNGLNGGNPVEVVTQQEQIWVDITYKE